MEFSLFINLSPMRERAEKSVVEKLSLYSGKISSLGRRWLRGHTSQEMSN